MKTTNSAPEVSEMTNARIKHYPDFDHYTVFNFSAFEAKRPRYRNDDETEPKEQGETTAKKECMRSDSIHRAKEKIFDISYLNEFSYFVTLTFNKDLHSREDAKAILHTVREYVRNIRKYDKTFSYLIIPEYHADKKSIHLHGLFTDSPRLRLVDSGHTAKGKSIFNISSWRYGFSTALKLDNNRIAVAKYITKYITKDVRKIFGNIYLAGNVNRNVPCELEHINFSAFNGVLYQLKDGLAVKYLEVYRSDETL